LKHYYANFVVTSATTNLVLLPRARDSELVHDYKVAAKNSRLWKCKTSGDFNYNLRYLCGVIPRGITTMLSVMLPG